HNIGGTWELNQTALITGVANESSFNVSNIADNNTGYLWNCEAYDSAGNSNFSGSNWTVFVDTVLPSVNLTINDTSVEWSDDHVLIDWNFSDLNSSYAEINITYPNGTLLTTVTNQGSDITLLTVNFTTTGDYTVTVFVNDSAGNVNLTIINITVGDVTSPVVNLVSPVTDTWSTTGNVTFTCNATNMNLTNISLYHNIGGTWELNQTALITGVANESS
ncbi:MAG: YfhO family protein, partial [Deltaproteobacteria bacterium]|nr:YfhO family protein [Deltaproteobacteria bacterium]